LYGRREGGEEGGGGVARAGVGLAAGKQLLKLFLIPLRAFPLKLFSQPKGITES